MARLATQSSLNAEEHVIIGIRLEMEQRKGECIWCEPVTEPLPHKIWSLSQGFSFEKVPSIDVV